MAFAQVSLEEIDPIDFGVIAVVRNDAQHALSLSHNGTLIGSAGIIVAVSAQPGLYRLSGLPPFQPVSMDLFSGFLARPGNLPPYFSLSDGNWDVPLRADQDGNLLFRMGARISTDGTNVGYADGSYAGLTTLRVAYDTLDGGRQHDFDVVTAVEVLNTLIVSEDQAINFGTISAWTDGSAQAAMRLSPTGTVTVTDAGNARIISLGNARPGQYRVSGGAAYAPVQLTLPTAPVILNRQGSSSGATLEASDFVARPGVDLSLDGQGQLQFALGATLRTEQTSIQLDSGVYSGSFSILIEYR